MDLVSAIVGAAVATAVAVLLYTQRHNIRTFRRNVSARVSAARDRLTRSAAATYREAVVELANRLHIAGHLLPLEDISIPRQFLAPRPVFDPLEPEDAIHDRPHELVPFVPDWPEAAGPYHLPAIPMAHLFDGGPHILLLGAPGSGRTVAMALLALEAVQSGREESSDGAHSRLPIYCELVDVPLEPDADADEPVDPLQPLLEAARPHLSGLAGRLLGAVRSELVEGRGLILVDGWDDLPTERQPRVVEWLAALIESYGRNQMVVAAPVNGYGALQSLRLAPAYLAPWSDADHRALAERWAAAWPAASSKGRRPAPPVDEDLVKRVGRGNRARTPLDVTLRIWSAFSRGEDTEDRLAWYRTYVSHAAPAPELVPALSRAAVRLLTGDEASGSLTVETLTALVDEAAHSVAGRPALSPPDFIYHVLRQSRLLTENVDGRLSFSHAPVAGYLAALAWDEETADRLAGSPHTRLILPFVAALGDVTALAEQRLARDGDLLHQGVLELAAWAADADLRAPWRMAVFTRLSELLLGGDGYPSTRERAMAALVASRDPNVSFVFKEGLQHQDVTVRRLSCLGLGAIGDVEAIVALGERIADPDPAVEVAATLALGAIGTEAALNYLIQVLLTGSDSARRAAAEMLAATDLAGEGHDVLREAAEESDPATRKAALYGLTRLRTPWAEQIISEAEKHDEQWLVRATAGSIMDRWREGRLDVRLPAPPPSPTGLRWLLHPGGAPEVEGDGSSAVALVQALRDDDAATRLAAAEALGALGAVDAVSALYSALRDEAPEVRDASLRALGSISQAAGRAFPDVL